MANIDTIDAHRNEFDGSIAYFNEQTMMASNL